MCERSSQLAVPVAGASAWPAIPERGLVCRRGPRQRRLGPNALPGSGLGQMTSFCPYSRLGWVASQAGLLQQPQKEGSAA